jgi:hypothetical protein
MADMQFPVKNCDTGSEGHVYAISLQLSSLAPHDNNMPFQHHVERLINCGHFGYRFKLDDNRDVGKADQHYFDFML